MENKLDLLQKIKRVDVPPFLYTRVLENINSNNTLKVSLFAKWSLTIAFTILVLLNAGILMKNIEKQKKSIGIESLAKELGLNSYNNLYNE